MKGNEKAYDHDDGYITGVHRDNESSDKNNNSHTAVLDTKISGVA